MNSNLPMYLTEKKKTHEEMEQSLKNYFGRKIVSYELIRKKKHEKGEWERNSRIILCAGDEKVEKE